MIKCNEHKLEQLKLGKKHHNKLRKAPRTWLLKPNQKRKPNAPSPNTKQTKIRTMWPQVWQTPTEYVQTQITNNTNIPSSHETKQA